MSLQSQIDTLRRITHELLNLGFEGTPLFSNEFCKLNTEVYRQSECLFHLHGSNAEEEAQLCYVLLTGYHATIYDHGDKNQKIQKLLDRSWKVLDQLPASLSKEAHVIINGWKGRELTLAECEVIEYLNSLESNPWGNWDVEE